MIGYDHVILHDAKSILVNDSSSDFLPTIDGGLWFFVASYVVTDKNKLTERDVDRVCGFASNRTLNF